MPISCSCSKSFQYLLNNSDALIYCQYTTTFARRAISNNYDRIRLFASKSGQPGAVSTSSSTRRTVAKRKKPQPPLRRSDNFKSRSSSSGSNKYQELAMKQNKRPEGFNPKYLEVGSSKERYVNYLVAALIGIVSGRYLFAEPLREYHASKAAEEQENEPTRAESEA